MPDDNELEVRVDTGLQTIFENEKYKSIPHGYSAIPVLFNQVYMVNAGSQSDYIGILEKLDAEFEKLGMKTLGTDKFVFGVSELIQNVQEHALKFDKTRNLEVTVLITPAFNMAAIYSETDAPVDAEAMRTKSEIESILGFNHRNRGLKMMGMLIDGLFVRNIQYQGDPKQYADWVLVRRAD